MHMLKSYIVFGLPAQAADGSILQPRAPEWSGEPFCLQGKAAPNYSDSALDAAERSTGLKRRRTFDTVVGEWAVFRPCTAVTRITPHFPRPLLWLLHAPLCQTDVCWP